MRRLERRQFVPVPKNRERRRCNTMYDKLNNDVWEAKVLEARFKEIPINIIKRFFKIKFESCKTFFFFDLLME
jgi:hypothetical protein